MILIPVTVIGAIAEHPLDFLGEVIFSNGDTTTVSSEVDELYKEFVKSDIGKKTSEYIAKKNKDQEKVYASSYYNLPLLMVVEEENGTFESLGFQKKLDKLFELRYKYSDDTEYIYALKNSKEFSKLNKLSDTTLKTYFDHFKGNSSIDGNYTVTGDSEAGVNIAKTALTKLDCPYYWGAVGPDYFDCSGFVYWVFQQNGYSYGRTTAEVLSTMGEPVAKEDLQAGDIITFMTVPGEVSHVGIYIGNGQMVHASGEGSTCLGNHASLGHVVKVATIFGSSYWESVTYNYRRLY